jgi:hypothetical protein
METQQPTAGKFAMNYGLILGAIMVLIQVVMYATGMAEEGTQWPVYLYYIIFPVIIFYAISQFKKENANLLSLGNALKVGLIIAMISALVNVVYGLVFNYIIDPEFMDKMILVTAEKLKENPNFTPEMIEQQMEIMKKFQNPLLGSAIWIALSAIFGLIYSLIAGLVMKKEE